MCFVHMIDDCEINMIDDTVRTNVGTVSPRNSRH